MLKTNDVRYPNISIDKIYEGVRLFSKQQYVKDQALFLSLAQVQKPHSLFITCCDSRIDPQLITSSKPGELFTVRSIANIVPPRALASKTDPVVSALEYSLEILKIEHIIICGHSNCGGCRALWDNSFFQKLPHLKNWLSYASRVKERVSKYLRENPEAKKDYAILIEKYNVLEQIKHLLTYPGVKRALKEGSLRVVGWYYRIDTGQVFYYDQESSAFIEIL